MFPGTHKRIDDHRPLPITGVEPGSRLGLYGFGLSAFLTIQVALDSGGEGYVATQSASKQAGALDLGAV